MKTTITLNRPQYIDLAYLTALEWVTGGKTHLVTRIKIDGVEEGKYRMTQGDTRFISNHLSGKVWLGKGNHEISLEYRTPGKVSFNFRDYGMVYL